MQRGIQGDKNHHAIHGESFSAFTPYPLPPNPELDMRAALSRSLSHADLMLGRLDGLSRILKHPEMLISFYVRKEAVLSSQIEGTQSTLTELLLFEVEPETATHDTEDVVNYIAAMRHGLNRMEGGFPLSLRLIKEMHEILLRSGRGSRSTPGEFRNSQNWIGGTRPGNAMYVPPPVHQMHEALGSFERFLHGAAEDFPVLVQCALLHVQFESIHPFLDGNGRLGRLLITLLLVQRGVLVQPMLYMSLYLKQNREEYYQHLQEVRFKGNWEEWVIFFLDGVASTAEKAVVLGKNILQLFEDHEMELRDVGARRGSALQVLQQMRETPYSSPRVIAERTGLSFNTVISALETLKRADIVHEVQGKRGRLYIYSSYIKLMDEGTTLD